MHVVYSTDVILPWEREDEFEKLHKAFRAEWKPSGYSEEQAVLDVTYYTWMKWRRSNPPISGLSNVHCQIA